MTIRGYIKRRVLWGFGAFFGSFFVTSVLTTWIGTPGPSVVAVGAIGTLIGLVGYVSIVFIRCPKCRANMGLTIAIPTAAHIFGRKVQYCPYCAVSLDDPMPPRP
jgi:hypothetical protein